jgi:hypothetical protein
MNVFDRAKLNLYLFEESRCNHDKLVMNECTVVLFENVCFV